MQAAYEVPDVPTPKLRRKPEQTAEEKSLYQQIYNYSRLWWPGLEGDPAAQDLYKQVLRHNARHAQRICVPASCDNWLAVFDPLLKSRGALPYHRVRLNAEDQVWYFFDRLQDVSTLIEALGAGVMQTPPPECRWQQRLKVPFARENYHAHLARYLQDRQVVPARMLVERDGDAWYFLNSLREVSVLLQGLDAFVPSRRPDGGDMVDAADLPGASGKD